MTLTGAVKATLVANEDGYASTTVTATRTGVLTFAATNTARVGKVNVRSTASAKAYAPKVLGPFWKVKAGKSAVWKVSTASPATAVTVQLSDGRQIDAVTDASGNAVLSTSFAKPGLIVYTVQVGGVQVFAGELTIVS